MHLVVVTSSFPETFSGEEAAGSFVHDFVHALAARVEVTVVAPARAPREEAAGRLRVRRFAVPRLPLSLLAPQRPRDWPAIAAIVRAGASAVADAVADADHVLALWALPCGYWARRAAARRGIGYSVWALGSDIWTLGRVPVVRGVLGRVLAGAHACFADGYALARDVERIGGRPCEFLASARRLPVAGARSLARTPPYRLAYLGRWHPNKGTDLLVEALARLDDAAWPRIAAVRIAGGGPLAGAVRDGVAALAARGRPVTVEGFLDKDAAAALLAWADWLVIPSRIESVPVVFSDAMQARCAVIASPVGDLPRLVADLGVGVLAEAPDAAALAYALARALDAAPADYADGFAEGARRFDVAANAARLLAAIGEDGDIQDR